MKVEVKTDIRHTTSIFLHSLKKSGFQGDIEDSYGARIVASTDNSVYQVLPEAILYPKVSDDINYLVTELVEYLTNNPESNLSIAARGAGTGTNGQSLNESLILDTSRYLNGITNFDEKRHLVTVEPGVVLDQLNQFLAPYDLFFPPDVSTSSRATLGGMVATDASGKGSRIYGKTSNYIHAMDVVLSDGSDFSVQSEANDTIDQTSENILASKIQRKVISIINDNKEKITDVFPKMNRGLTGYNLEHVITDDGQIKLSYLLAGSEGTLALTKSITLSVIPKPKLYALVVVLYNDFDSTLEHISSLLKAQPTAIEVLDDKILEVAQRDSLWQDVEKSFSSISLSKEIRGLNFIEVTADTEIDIKNKTKALSRIIDETKSEFGIMSHLVETDKKVISSLWGIRKRAVGLLASIEGSRRPLAFVEDCAVPPESLPAFIKDFRAILDQHNLSYGMYGHADVGCLHVRPALNMMEEGDQKLIRIISDEVAKLSKRYNGLLWGEHGRGFRGEYSPFFFGEELYPLLGEIKKAFDPDNLFNPGKLATPNPSKQKVKAIDEITFRGEFDSQILLDKSVKYQSAMLCNGNAACFSWDVGEAMCPSYKVTRDKRLSPKGRATMLREWLRLLSEDTDHHSVITKLETEIFQSLSSCLSCKSCTHSCPIKVDIPELKSRFLESYFANGNNKVEKKNLTRPISDYLFGSFELVARVGRIMPSTANLLIQNPIVKKLLEIFIGIINPPRFSHSLAKGLKKRQTYFIDLKKDSLDKEKSLILLPDAFNASYYSSVILSCYDVLTDVGYKVYVAPVLKNGKALHVKGYREKFRQVANVNISQMTLLASKGASIISPEVVTRFMYVNEYPQISGKPINLPVLSIEEWLIKELENNPDLFKNKTGFGHSQDVDYRLLPHCMEQTADKHSAIRWQSLFNVLGMNLEIKNAGCCGMSGLFGHEKTNQQLAERIYKKNWHDKVEINKAVLVTGFSCRCQLDNHGVVARHPIEVIAELMSK